MPSYQTNISTPSGGRKFEPDPDLIRRGGYRYPSRIPMNTTAGPRRGKEFHGTAIAHRPGSGKHHWRIVGRSRSLSVRPWRHHTGKRGNHRQGDEAPPARRIFRPLQHCQREGLCNAKACAAWSPNPERTCHPISVFVQSAINPKKTDNCAGRPDSEIIDAIPRIPDPNAARDQIFNLLHWTQGPGQKPPHAPPPMRLTLITLISVFVQSAINPEKTDHEPAIGASQNGIMRAQGGPIMHDDSSKALDRQEGDRAACTCP